MRYREVEKAKALEELLSAAGLTIEGVNAKDRKLLAKARKQALEFLEGLANMPANQSEGGTRILVGDKHVSVRALLWEVASSALSLVPRTLDPTGITQTVGLVALGKALLALGKKITGLDAIQLTVCRAVVTINRRKVESRRILIESGASAGEVAAEVETMIGRKPEGIADMLRHLHGKKVLKEEFHGASQPFYFLVP